MVSNYRVSIFPESFFLVSLCPEDLDWERYFYHTVGDNNQRLGAVGTFFETTKNITKRIGTEVQYPAPVACSETVVEIAVSPASSLAGLFNVAVKVREEAFPMAFVCLNSSLS